MNKTSEKETSKVDVQQGGTAGVSLNSVMRLGGVTLQNIRWNPVAGFDQEKSTSSLPLTLDLLSHESLGAESRKQLFQIMPEYVQPIVIYGAAPLISPALEIETFNEMVQVGNSSGIEPQLHTIRIKVRVHNTVHNKAHNTVDSKSAKAFDTILYCSGLAIGSKSVIIGAAFLDEADGTDSARESLRQLLRQLCADQIALTYIISRCSQLPDLARVLINSDSGEIVWRNEAAVSKWKRRSSQAKYIAERISDTGQTIAEDSESIKTHKFTLITFLRSNLKTESNPSLLQRFDLGSDIRLKLSNIVDSIIEEKKAEALDSTVTIKRSITSAVVKSDEIAEDAIQSSATNSTSSSTSRADSLPAEAEPFGDARRALEVALRHLPEGGRLKLTPIDESGAVRLESFDRNGADTLDITLKDKAHRNTTYIEKTFPTGDEIL